MVVWFLARPLMMMDWPAISRWISLRICISSGEASTYKAEPRIHIQKLKQCSNLAARSYIPGLRAKSRD